MGRRSGSWCGIASTTLPLGIKRGPWTPEEDQKLLAFIQQHGHGSWRSLPQKAGLRRCGKSCRLRWRNYLRPDIKRGNFSLHEDQTIIQLHALLGNRWSSIAAHLPKRTDNEIKNYWNTHLKKRLAKIGFDPVTHKPIKAAILGSADADPKNTANLSHIAQWESARLQAEARFVRESKLRTQHDHNNDNIDPHVSASGHLLYHDQTAGTHDHFAPPPPPPPQCLDILRAWETLLSRSRAVGSGGKEGSVGVVAAVGGGATEGQYGNYVPLGHHDVNIVGVSGCDHFEPPILMDNSSGAVMSTTAGSHLDFSEVLGQCGNSEYCSELFAALNHYSMMGFEVGDAWTTSEQCNNNGPENVISEIWA